MTYELKPRATDFGGRDNLTAVETPTTLRRPNPNGDEKIPTGSPPDTGRRKETPSPNARRSRGAGRGAGRGRLLFLVRRAV